MDWTLTQSDEDNAELRDYVRKGMLFAVQDWIAAEKPLYKKGSRKQQPLEIAVDKGFHSMVQILADVWPDQESLIDALHQATWKRRTDLVWVLLKHVSDLSCVDLGSVARCNDKDLIRFFLDRWDELKNEYGLYSIVTEMSRPLIGLVREYAPQIPGAQVQLAAALKDFVEADHPKWIALTMWMGGDPRLPAPTFLYDDEEPEEWTSALQDAASGGKLRALKVMKPNRELDDLNALLGSIHLLSGSDTDAADYLVQCGADINNKPNGGSSVLDAIFTTARFRRGLYCREGFTFSDAEVVKRWITRGARWVPDTNFAFQEVRAAIIELEEGTAWSFIQFLSETVERDVLLKLCNTKRMLYFLQVEPKVLRQRIDGFHTKREAARERRRFYPRIPKGTTFVQRRPRVLGIKETRTTRTRLHKEIWSRPMTEIAADYLVGTEQLGYVCNEHRIPRPRVGHWQMVSAGRPTEQRPLPEPEHDPEVVIRSHDRLPEISSPPVRGHVALLIGRLATPALQVTVPDQPEEVHRLLSEYRQARTETRARPWRRGDVPAVLAIRVREDLQERAERVMNALLVFLEDLGLKLSVSERTKGYPDTEATMYGSSVGFELDQEGGKLRLKLFGPGYYFRGSWSDGRRQFVEECFADFAVCMVYAVALKGAGEVV